MRTSQLLPLTIVLLVLLAGCSLPVPTGGSTNGADTTRSQATQAESVTSTNDSDVVVLRQLLDQRKVRDPYGFDVEERTVNEGSGLETVTTFRVQFDASGNLLMDGHQVTDDGTERTKFSRRIFFQSTTTTDEYIVYSSWGENNTICVENRTTVDLRKYKHLPIKLDFDNISQSFAWQETGTTESVRTFEADKRTEFGHDRTSAMDSVSAELRVGTSPIRLESYTFTGRATGDGTTIRISRSWQRLPFTPDDRLSPDWTIYC